MHAAEPRAASGGGVRTTSLLVASLHNMRDCSQSRPCVSFQALFILTLIHIFGPNDRPFFISDYFFFFPL